MNLPSATQIKEHLKHHFLFWGVIFLVIVLATFYFFGYRPGPGLTFSRIGFVEILNIPDGTTVYTDASSRGFATGGSLRANLVPGNHTVIVDAPNMQPWQTIISVTSNQTTAVVPVLVTKQPESRQLTGNERTEALMLLNVAKLPSEASPLSMGCTQVFNLGNRIIAAATTSTECTPPEFLCSEDGTCEPTVIFSPIEPLRSVVAFPGHDDVIVMTVGEWIYVLGLDPRTPQFFAPLARGTAPKLATYKGKIIVGDAGNVYELSL
ncbi:MAG: hypothetical protein WAV21_01330 [Minisyncoccia bacterium]